CAACATSRPSPSNTATEKSRRSRMLGLTALRTSRLPACSHIAASRLWQISSRTGSGAVAMRAWCRRPERRSTGLPINAAAPVTAQGTGAGVHRRSPGSASAAATAAATASGRHLVPGLLRLVELVVAERLLHRVDALLHLLGLLLPTVVAHLFDEPGHAL